MEISLRYFHDLTPDSIYSLLKDVYTTSDSMSESFAEKFPDENSCFQYFSDLLNLPGGIVLFAEIEGIPAGYLVVKPRHQANIRHTSELNMGVRSKYRGKGVGGFLLLNALKMAVSSKEIEIIYLMVRADNIPAIKLYKKFGFEKLALLERDTKINGNYYDGIFMRKFIF